MKEKLLVYMLQSQYGSTVDNNMLGHWDANTIKKPIEVLMDFFQAQPTSHSVDDQSLYQFNILKIGI